MAESLDVAIARSELLTHIANESTAQSSFRLYFPFTNSNDLLPIRENHRAVIVSVRSAAEKQ